MLVSNYSRFGPLAPRHLRRYSSFAHFGLTEAEIETAAVAAGEAAKADFLAEKAAYIKSLPNSNSQKISVHNYVIPTLLGEGLVPSGFQPLYQPIPAAAQERYNYLFNVKVGLMFRGDAEEVQDSAYQAERTRLLAIEASIAETGSRAAWDAKVAAEAAAAAAEAEWGAILSKWEAVGKLLHNLTYDFSVVANRISVVQQDIAKVTQQLMAGTITIEAATAALPPMRAELEGLILKRPTLILPLELATAEKAFWDKVVSTMSANNKQPTAATPTENDRLAMLEVAKKVAQEKIDNLAATNAAEVSAAADSALKRKISEAEQIAANIAAALKQQEIAAASGTMTQADAEAATRQRALLQETQAKVEEQLRIADAEAAAAKQALDAKLKELEISTEQALATAAVFIKPPAPQPVAQPKSGGVPTGLIVAAVAALKLLL